MGIYDNWTYTDLHQLNLDWILKTIRDYVQKTDQLSLSVDGLKQYIESQLSDDNIKQMVFEKLDTWLADGTLSTLFSNYVQGFITPQMYGAVADGQTDDSIALNASIAAAFQNSKMLILSGSYYINTPILIDQGQPLVILGSKSQVNTLLSESRNTPFNALSPFMVMCILPLSSS